MADFIYLLFPTSWLNVFIDVLLPILWYANNLHDALLISGMPWSTTEAPQWEESHGKNLRLDPGCEVNALATSVSSRLYQQRLFEFDWNERESKQLERSESVMENVLLYWETPTFPRLSASFFFFDSLLLSPRVSIMFTLTIKHKLFLLIMHIESKLLYRYHKQTTSQLLAITQSNLLKEDKIGQLLCTLFNIIS